MNVFPIADRDTGRNLSKTLQAIQAETRLPDVPETLFLGSRGNSGNMLSLFFRPWPLYLDSVSTLKNSLITAQTQLEKYIPNLVHGTIYDVMTCWSPSADTDFDRFFKAWLRNAEQVILNGPDILSVLDMYGTLDSGAIGLYYVLGGIAAELGIEYNLRTFYVKRAQKPLGLLNVRYCTEALVKSDGSQALLADQLKDLGESLILVKGPDYLKLHIHTNSPEKVRDILESYGAITDWKVDDMKKASE